MKRLAQLIVVLSVAGFLQACGCETIDTGNRGLQTRFGALEGEPLPEGLHFYNPFTSSIKEISVREEKLEGTSPSYTKDTQIAVIQYALTYAPDPAQIGNLYKNAGDEWAKKIVEPLVRDAIQDAIGIVAADDLMGKREETRMLATRKMAEALSARGVLVRQLAFTNVDFDDAYEKAVENKVVAIQNAAGAKNRTVEIEENARQVVIAAKAEAESMQIRSQALSQNKGLVEFEAVKRWDGKLPQYMMGGSATPFINLAPAK